MVSPPMTQSGKLLFNAERAEITGAAFIDTEFSRRLAPRATAGKTRQPYHNTVRRLRLNTNRATGDLCNRTEPQIAARQAVVSNAGLGAIKTN